MSTPVAPPERSSSPWEGGEVPEPAGAPGRPGWVLLAVVLFTGPAVWAVHLAATSALVPAACSRGAGWSINALTGLCAVAIAAAIVPSVRLLRTHRPGGPDPDPTLALIGALGILWGAISLLVTVVEGVPNLVLDACPV
jgi:hypothetical protein